MYRKEKLQMDLRKAVAAILLAVLAFLMATGCGTEGPGSDDGIRDMLYRASVQEAYFRI